MIAAIRGDVDRMQLLTADVARTATPAGARFFLVLVQSIRGVSAIGSADYEQAYQHLRRVFDPADPAFHESIRLWAIADYAEAAIHTSHATEAQATLDGCRAFAGETPALGIQVGLLFATALLTPDSDAQECFDRLLSVELSRWPFVRARILLAYGTWLRRQRRTTQSRASLRMALDCFEVVGAAPWSDRARAELRASGVTVGHRPSGRHETLTMQELQIARLAAEGLTNREIAERLYLSRRTVGSHLYRVFPKLGIKSRAALGAALAS